MNPETNQNLPAQPDNNSPETSGRREMLGKFAAYAAPFTVLAFAQKADAATGTGPGKHIKPAR